MSDAETAPEPSMEEILASIRRIISEDDEGEAQPGAGDLEDDLPSDLSEGEAPVVEAEVEDQLGEVVDLVDRTEPTPEPAEPIFEPEPEPAPVVHAEPVIEPEPEPFVEPEPYVEPVAAPVVYDKPALETSTLGQGGEEVVASSIEEDVADELLSPQTSTQLAGLMGQLSAKTAVNNGPDAQSLEGVVRELLRPMLQTWLDEHLPPLVERIVEREIQRVTRRG